MKIKLLLTAAIVLVASMMSPHALAREVHFNFHNNTAEEILVEWRCHDTGKLAQTNIVGDPMKKFYGCKKLKSVTVWQYPKAKGAKFLAQKTFTSKDDWKQDPKEQRPKEIADYDVNFRANDDGTYEIEIIDIPYNGYIQTL